MRIAEGIVADLDVVIDLGQNPLVITQVCDTEISAVFVNPVDRTDAVEVVRHEGALIAGWQSR